MSTAMPGDVTSSTREPLGDPALRKVIEDFVRRRVPSSEVDDVVQTVLCDALAASGRPADPDELRRWLLGVARHKVVDHHRRAHREVPAELPDLEAAPAPVEARGLVRWAEEQAGPESEAQKTLGWMAREGEGDKLEAIAADEQLPAARVRQRVSRMRRWMKERWLAELAAVAVLGAVALIVYLIARGNDEAPVTHDEPDPSPSAAPDVSPDRIQPLDRARMLRAEAFEACEHGAFRLCLDDLDQARGVDPEGDRDPAVGAARDKALRGLDGEKSNPGPSKLDGEKNAPPSKIDGPSNADDPANDDAPRTGKVRKKDRAKPVQKGAPAVEPKGRYKPKKGDVAPDMPSEPKSRD